MQSMSRPSTAVKQPCTSTTTTTPTPIDDTTVSATAAPQLVASTASISAGSKHSISLLSSSSSVSASNHHRPASVSGSSSISPRVVFGAGTVARLPTELGRLGLSSPLIVSSPSRIGLARHIQALIPNFDSHILDSALVNVPAHIVDGAVARVTGRDCVISVGGTTALGLARSIASAKAIPHICIPTTYSGSEMGPVLSEARRRARHRRSRKNAEKKSNSSASVSTSSTSREHDVKMLPNVIIYDEDLTASAPRRISAPTTVEIMASSRCRRNSEDEDAQWSYIHLPGV